MRPVVASRDESERLRSLQQELEQERQETDRLVRALESAETMAAERHAQLQTSVASLHAMEGGADAVRTGCGRWGRQRTALIILLISVPPSFPTV